MKLALAKLSLDVYDKQKSEVTCFFEKETEEDEQLINFAFEEKNIQRTIDDLSPKFGKKIAIALVKVLEKEPNTWNAMHTSALNRLKTVKEDMKRDLHKPFVGQILKFTSSYNATSRFYQVVKVTKCFVWIKQINSEVTQNIDGYNQRTYERPIKDDFRNNEPAKRYKIKTNGGKRYYISMSYGLAEPWNGADAYNDYCD